MCGFFFFNANAIIRIPHDVGSKTVKDSCLLPLHAVELSDFNKSENSSVLVNRK